MAIEQWQWQLNKNLNLHLKPLTRCSLYINVQYKQFNGLSSPENVFYISLKYGKIICTKRIFYSVMNSSQHYMNIAKIKFNYVKEK